MPSYISHISEQSVYVTKLAAFGIISAEQMKDMIVNCESSELLRNATNVK